MINYFKIFASIGLIILSFYIISCSENSVSPPDPEKYTTKLKGKVFLENQTEHSNALIYLKELNIGTSSDSSGRFILDLSESESNYSGQTTIYYFLEDYFLDSAVVYLNENKVKIDTLDFGQDASLKKIELKQRIRVNGYLSKNSCSVGDTVTFSVEFINPSNQNLTFSIFSAGGTLSSNTGFYVNERIEPHNPPTFWDIKIELQPGGIYKGNMNLDANVSEIGTYVVITTFLFGENGKENFFDKYPQMTEFIWKNWISLHRCKNKCFDMFPNKYNYPQITIKL
ncbi:MAG: hypothetical protein JEY94_13190 [Melioribacteraceae bacterium]|nr:hypothetical protein [Melioribacteraceae bacterium]